MKLEAFMQKNYQECKKCGMISISTNVAIDVLDIINNKIPLDQLKNPDNVFETEARILRIERKEVADNIYINLVTFEAYIDGWAKIFNSICDRPPEDLDSVSVTIYVYNIKKNIKTICDHCLKKHRKYLSNYMPYDKTFDILVWSHGVNAFNIASSIDDVINRIKFVASSKAQICCSHKTQRIGNVGVFVRGKVICASNVDLYSYIDEEGERYTPFKTVLKHIVRNFSEYRLDICEFTEIILVPNKVYAIWAKEEFIANETNRQALEKVAHELGVKIIKVK